MDRSHLLATEDYESAGSFFVTVVTKTIKRYYKESPGFVRLKADLSDYEEDMIYNNVAAYSVRIPQELLITTEVYVARFRWAQELMIKGLKGVQRYAINSDLSETLTSEERFGLDVFTKYYELLWW